MKKLFPVLLSFLLLCSFASAQENTVVALPTVAPLAQVTLAPAADYTTASLAEYYEANFYMDREDYQTPRMTAEEKERAKTLLAAYQTGERPTQNVLDKMENAVVGVYTLNPEDYGGETLFTLLPVDPLTDEQILEVIDAFARSGRTFDPEALSYRNCMRGGGLEVTRFFQKDENDRRVILRELYIRQGLKPQAPYTPLVADDGMGMATLDADAYCGMDSFLFLPSRPLTDDELLSYIAYTETGDPTEYGNYEDYEIKLRAELTRLLGAPLVLTREYESMGRMGDYNVSYGDEKVYCGSFLAADGTNYWGCLDVDAGVAISANVWKENHLLYSDMHLDPFDPKWTEIAKAAVSAVRGDGAAIQTAESSGEAWLSMAGFGPTVNVTMEDGGVYTMTIAYQNESIYDGMFYQSHADDLTAMFGVTENNN